MGQYRVGDNFDTLDLDLSKFLIDPFFRLGDKFKFRSPLLFNIRFSI